MIVDASVAVKWILEEEGSEAARDLLGRVDLFAPALIHSEVGNALWKKRRRGEFAADVDLAMLPDLFASLIRTVDEAPMMRRALDLAIGADHPIYDCVYLARAEALDTELTTADAAFARKMGGAGGTARIRLLA